MSQWRGLLLNCLVHPRLSETGLVSFIVTIVTVTDNVDHDVLLVLGMIISGKLADEIDCLNVVTIDMEDWCIDGLGNI